MTTVATASAPPRQHVSTKRWFFAALSAVTAITVFAGFAPTYFLKQVYGAPALSGLLHVHGAVFSSWVVLLIAQTALVTAGRTDLHRRLGVAGGALAAVMTVLAYFVAVDAARRGSTIPGMSPLAFLAIPFATVVVFPSVVGAALWYRRRPDVHKRLMVVSTAELLPAAIGRLPFMVNAGPLGFFGGADLVIIAMAIYDYATIRRLHPATLYGGLFMIASQVIRVLVTASPAWTSFAQWLIG
jgi:hypothetical protein